MYRSKNNGVTPSDQQFKADFFFFILTLDNTLFKILRISSRHSKLRIKFYNGGEA